jgi:hypothetical protein
MIVARLIDLSEFFVSASPVTSAMIYPNRPNLSRQSRARCWQRALLGAMKTALIPVRSRSLSSNWIKASSCRTVLPEPVGAATIMLFSEFRHCSRTSLCMLLNSGWPKTDRNLGSMTSNTRIEWSLGFDDSDRPLGSMNLRALMVRLPADAEANQM